MFVSLIFSYFLLGLINFSDACPEKSGCNACPEESGCKIRLVYGEESSLLSVHNDDTHAAVIIDSENDMSLVCDGISGEQFLYDYKEDKGFQIIKHDQYSWEASRTDIQAYMKSMKSLKNIVISGDTANEFAIESPPDDIIEKHYKITSSFQKEMVDYGEVRRRGFFSMFVNLLRELCKLKKYSLRKIIETKLRAKSFIINGGLMNVVSVFRGLSSLINETSGYVEADILREKFDMQPLFMTETGGEALVTIVDQMNNPDSPAFEIVKYPRKLFNVVREFDGGLYTGIRGIGELVYHVGFFLKNQISFELFIDHFIQVAASIKKISYKLILKKIKLAMRILKKKMSPSYSNHVLPPLKDFLKSKLIIGNINIPKIVKSLLVGTSESGVQWIIHVLYELKKDFFINVSTLFVRLVFFTLSGRGLFFILKLLPSLKSVIDLNSHEPTYSLVTRKMKPLSTIRKLLKNKVENVVGSIPVIGDIFVAIMEALVKLKQLKRLWVRELLKTGTFPIISSWIRYGQKGQKPPGYIHEMGLWGIDRANGCSCFD